LHLFELEDGKSAGTTIYGQDGSPVMEARFARRGKTITAAIEGASASWRLLLRGITSVAFVNDGSAEADPLGTLIKPGKNQRGMEIRLG
ncbi:MAG: alpha-xylosidase, partial [Bacteroidota bacterium]